MPPTQPELVRSPSPPPPEEGANHPAYLTDSTRPLVHFPSPESPVHSPPQQGSYAQPESLVSVMPSSTGLAPPHDRANDGQKKASSTAFWQSKFDGLFERKSPRLMQMKQPETSSIPHEDLSAERLAPVAPVASATKKPFEHDFNVHDASVNIPQAQECPSFETSSKNVEDEEAMFEDRDPGSRPVVCLPTVVSPAFLASAAASPGSTRLNRVRGFNKFNVQPTSVESFHVNALDRGELINGHGVYVVVRLPGVDKEMVKSVLLPKKHMSSAMAATISSPSSPRSKSMRRKSGKKDKNKAAKNNVGGDSGNDDANNTNTNANANAQNGNQQPRRHSRKSFSSRRQSSVASRLSINAGATSGSASSPQPPLPNTPTNISQGDHTPVALPSPQSRTPVSPTSQAPRKPKTWADRATSGGSN